MSPVYILAQVVALKGPSLLWLPLLFSFFFLGLGFFYIKAAGEDALLKAKRSSNYLLFLVVMVLSLILLGLFLIDSELSGVAGWMTNPWTRLAYWLSIFGTTVLSFPLILWNFILRIQGVSREIGYDLQSEREDVSKIFSKN